MKTPQRPTKRINGSLLKALTLGIELGIELPHHHHPLEIAKALLKVWETVQEVLRSEKIEEKSEEKRIA